MRNRSIYAAVLLAILSMSAACDKTPQLPSEYSTDPDTVLIDAYVGALTRSNPLGENQTRFNAGDRISVVHTSANKQVDYTYDGTYWISVGDDYLVWQTDKKNTFRIQYPFIGYEGVFGEYFKNQSTLEEMSKSDLMEAVVEVDPIPSDKRLVAELKRQRSLVTVKIVGFNDEFSNDQKVTDLKLHLWDGGQGDEIISVTPYIRDEKGVAQPAGTVGRTGYSYTAIGRNDCDYRGNAFITLTVAGKDLTVANPAPMEIGKRYTYELTVGKGAVRITGVTVEDWTTGVTLDGKFEAEVDNYSEWDGKKITYTHYFYGEGTSESPYLIKSAADLAGLAANVNAGNIYNGEYFKLESNIDLMGHEWMPIGNSGNPFGGFFDGNSKIITNMAITAAPSDKSGVGLFGNCSGASVSNVVLRNAKITYSGEVSFPAGLICGEFSGTVKNCRIDGSIVTKDAHCGGIIGKIEDSTSVLDCEVEIYAETPWGACGGIVGYSMDENLTIESCTAKGEINGGNDGFGGIAGYLSGQGVLVKNCTSYVRLGKSTDGAHPRVGGLAGFFNYGKAENCTVYGSISFTNDSCSAGGMFSEVCDVTLSNLNFSGDIDVTVQGSSVMMTYIGAYIAWINRTATTATGCTYKKSGTGDYPAVGHCADESFDPNTLDIKGI